MYLKFTGKVAINVVPNRNAKTASFYRALGLETKSHADDVTALGPGPFECFVVSWDPPPEAQSCICLQMETDDLDEARVRIEQAGGEVLFFGTDDQDFDSGPRHLWMRDPAGNLMNIIERLKS